MSSTRVEILLRKHVDMAKDNLQKKIVDKVEHAPKSLEKKRLSETLKEESWSDKCKRIISGHRVVNSLTVAKDLWCKTYDMPFSLRYATEESRSGLVFILTIPCTKCSINKLVRTSEPDPNEENVHYVNTMATMGVMDTGIGKSHLNTLFSVMDIPALNLVLLKRYEQIIGEAIIILADESCAKALETEKELTI